MNDARREREVAFHNPRTGQHTQPTLMALLRQAIYSRLAGLLAGRGSKWERLPFKGLGAQSSRRVQNKGNDSLIKSALNHLARGPTNTELVLTFGWIAAVWTYLRGYIAGHEGLVALFTIGLVLVAGWSAHLFAGAFARFMCICRIKRSRWNGLRWAFSPLAAVAALTAILWSDCDLLKKLPLVGRFDWSRVLGNTAIKPALHNEELHERYRAMAGKSEADVVFLGDSITNSFRAEGKQVWEQTFAPLRAVNFGIGNDRTQNVIWRIQHGALDGCHPRVLVLLIGQNNLGSNTADEIVEGIALIVDILRSARPQTRILLLGIFPRGADPADPDRTKIRAVNTQLARLADDKYVRFMDIGNLFLDPDGHLNGFMPDHCHLSPEGYQYWANAICPQLRAMLREPK